MNSQTVLFIGTFLLAAAPAYSQFPQTLNINRSGSGSVSATGPGASSIVCPSICSGQFLSGTTVTLNATPTAADTELARTRIAWTGSVIDDGNPLQRRVTMPGGGVAVSVGVNFVQQFRLNLEVFGSGRITNTFPGVSGVVDCSHSGDPTSSSTCSAFFDQTQAFPFPTYVVLFATPEPGWRVAWSGDVLVNPANPNECHLAFRFSGQNVTARFTPIPPGLYISKSGGGGGTVTSIPAGINCGTDCEEATGSPGFGPGELVALRATPATGSIFAGWSGDGYSLPLNPLDRNVLMLADTVHTVSARFDPIRLTLTKSGPGQGTVTTLPPGSFNCPPGCSISSLDLPAPQLVTLTNAPVAPWFAAGWTVGGVTYPGAAITLNVMGPTNVVALYSYRPGNVDAGYFAPAGTTGAGEVTAMEALPGCRLLVADGRVLRVHQSGFNFIEVPGFHRNAVNGIIAAIRRLTNGPHSGKIMVGGTFTEVDAAPPGGTEMLPRVGLLRLLPDGTVDPSFTTPVPGVVMSFLQQADGKVLVGGAFTQVGEVPRHGLARLHSDGTVDASFNVAALTDPLGAPGSIRSMAFQTVGDSDYLLIAGDFVTVGGVPRTGGVARLRRDTGALDESFNPPASYTLSGGEAPYTVVVQPDNKILLAGSLPVPGGALRTNLFRFTEMGGLDSTFNPTNIGPGEITQLALQPDGKIIIVGEFTEIGGKADAIPVVPPVTRNRIARLLPNGILDLEFSPGTGANFTVREVVVQSNERVMVGGRFTSIDGRPNTVHLARLYGDPPHDPLPCEVPLRRLRVRVSPEAGGLVDYGLAGASLNRTCNLDCTTEYFDGSTVELAATRASASWTFAGWTVDGQPVSDNPLQLNLAGDHEVTARFDSVCFPGFYSEGGVCRPAPPGYFVPEAGATSPTICPPGYFTASEGSVEPTPAAPGFYVPGPGATTPLEVPAGNYAAGPAATSYTVCPAGSYAPAGSAAPILCPAGYYAPEGSAAPTICPPGYYAASEGSIAPTPAAPGFYVPAPGATTPLEVPAGNYAAGPAATSYTVCPAGSYAPAGSAAPILCPAGYYAPEGSAAPIECPGSPAGSGTCSTLTVTRTGSGEGTVASNPSGIDCGTDCAKFFAPGTVVTLTAIPNATSIFIGWGGACSGSGDCIVTMEMARTVSAVFDAVIRITAQSGDVTICTGESTTLFVTAIEPVGRTLNYQWRRDGEPVGDNSRTLAVNQAGVYGVTLTLSGGGGVEAASVPMLVRVGQAPVAVADTVLASPATSVAIPLAALLANDTDPDGDPLSVFELDSTSTAGGTVTRAAGDSLIYTPPTPAPATDTFHYRVSDGACPAAVGTVTVRFVSSPTPAVNELVIVPAPSGGGGGGFLLPFTAPGPGTYVLLRAAFDVQPLIWTIAGRREVIDSGQVTFSFFDGEIPSTGAIYRVQQVTAP